MIEVSREKLEKLIELGLKKARPYTGEYWMGKVELANELLGNSSINWDDHPNFHIKKTKKEEK